MLCEHTLIDGVPGKMNDKILVVANPGEIHVGAHLIRAAKDLGNELKVLDISQAMRGAWFFSKISWHLCGHTPVRLKVFSDSVMTECRNFMPKWMIATGFSSVDARTLKAVNRMGVITINFLTDDPWNPSQRSRWFIKSIVEYQKIFTPRKSNMDDLKEIGCRSVSFLPFAYSPYIHHGDNVSIGDRFDWDVIFAGGADRDRIPYVRALIDNGIKLGLYGGYWHRLKLTKPIARGVTDAETYRKVTARAKIALCLVRRANRDGHAMRSFEIPAIGTCMLTEDTLEHREIFGEEGKAVVYFKTIEEMVQKAKYLLDNESERLRLAGAAHQLIVNGRNTYKDRLETMLGLV